MPTWNLESFWMDLPYDIIIKIKVHKYSPYAWKYHMCSTERIPKYWVWLAVHNRGAPEFNTLEQKLYKVRSDSAENELDPVQLSIYYNAKFAQNPTAVYYWNAKSNINKHKPKRMATNSPYNSYSDVLHRRWDKTSVWNF